VRLSLFAIAEVGRSDIGVQHLKRLHYLGINELYNSSIDGLIITGAEPAAAELVEEPYWGTLTQVFDWADDNTLSTVSSCLAVHAAVLHFDGINRYSLDDKCFGVFDVAKVSDDPLVNGVSPPVRIPHSRCNSLRAGDLTRCGYTTLLRSPRAGVDTFIKRRRSLFVFLHGHPEYEAWTLLGEYRRDIERYLRYERDSYPSMPFGYFEERAATALSRFQERALSNRSRDQMARFPASALAGTLADPWRANARQLYHNWLLLISERKRQRPQSYRSSMVVAEPKRILALDPDPRIPR
jgi:homoserine O-succinyltransferase